MKNEKNYETADKSRFDEVSLKALPCSHSPIFAKKKNTQNATYTHATHSLKIRLFLSLTFFLDKVQMELLQSKVDREYFFKTQVYLSRNYRPEISLKIK